MTSTLAQHLQRHRVFLAATAAVMLHVADDNFLQPNPGVSAGDHLVSGLVPLAALLAAAAAYPRVRPGTRAVLAFAVGLTGIVTGAVEAGYYTFSVGPSGDDFTGWLAAVAGLVLVGLGGRLLWRSRRRDGSRARRYARRIAKGVVAAVIVGELVGPFADDVPHHPREPRRGPGARPGRRPRGRHAHHQRRAAPARLVRPLEERRRRHRLPRPQADRRRTRGCWSATATGCCCSTGAGRAPATATPTCRGWGGQRDIHAAVDFLQHRPDVDPARIGGIGFSVGGEMMLQAAAENKGLAAVVSEGAGTRSIKEEMVEYDGRTLLRGFHALVAKQAGIALFADELPPPSLVDLVPRIAPRPTLLIWAPNGGNRETMNPLYQRLIGPSAEIWAMDDVRHIRGLQSHPEEYERRVVGFFDDALLDDAPAHARQHEGGE